MELGGVDGDLGDGFVAGVGGGEVLLLRVVEGLLGDDAVLGHGEGAVVGVLVHGKVGGLGVDLVVLDGGLGGAGVGFGGGELGLLGVDLGEDLDLIELGEDLSLLDAGVDVDVERVTMPEALDLSSTLVMGWTLPVATTERAMSPFSTLASCDGSSLALLPRAATVTPRMTAMTRAMMPPHIQSFRFLLRCVAKVKLQ